MILLDLLCVAAGYIACALVSYIAGALSMLKVFLTMHKNSLPPSERKKGPNMNPRLRAALDIFAARLSEPSTWQGLGFVFALSGAKFGVGLDWGQAAGLGGMVSALIKMCTPDPKP